MMVFVGHGIAGVVRRQADADAVIDVGPLRVVVSGFGGEGHLGHEGEGGGEIGETEFGVQGVVLGSPGHGLIGIKTR